MFQTRFHGRGGQGVVTAAELLSVAAFDEGLHAQAVPSFGSERTGAPGHGVLPDLRPPIRAHDPVDHPDVVIVQDPTLFASGDLLAGLTPGGLVVVNSGREVAALGVTGAPYRPELRDPCPATALAREILGRPLPNTALLGVVTELTGVVSLAALQAAIRERFSGETGEQNARLAAAAAALVREGGPAPR